MQLGNYASVTSPGAVLEGIGRNKAPSALVEISRRISRARRSCRFKHPDQAP